MFNKLLDKSSYSIIRANPKLTANVKLISNGSDLYLESFSANTELASSTFKSFKISGKDTYDRDVWKFFQGGKFPANLGYEVFQEFEDVSVLSQYQNQFEMFYSAGTRSVSSNSYSEDLGMLAPIWLNEQIPNNFVIFRIDNPAAVNNINETLQDANYLKPLIYHQTVYLGLILEIIETRSHFHNHLLIFHGGKMNLFNGLELITQKVDLHKRGVSHMIV